MPSVVLEANQHMWIFTSGGFVSIVENYKQPGSLLVRARKKEHLREFLTAQGQLNSDAHDFSETPGRDYRWRASVSAEQLEEIALCNVRAITYTNFKNSIRDGEYRHVASEVWTAGGSMQEGGLYGIGRGSPAPDRYTEETIL